MINIRNTIISELYNYIQKPIIANTSTQPRPSYPFADYSITTNIGDTGEGNLTLEPIGDDVKEILSLQNKISFSFNVYSKNEVECYNLAKDIWDWFRHKNNLTNIAVVEVMEINNRTILEVDAYEIRYGFDVIVRYKDTIDKTSITIDDYSIKEKE